MDCEWECWDCTAQLSGSLVPRHAHSGQSGRVPHSFAYIRERIGARSLQCAFRIKTHSVRKLTFFQHTRTHIHTSSLVHYVTSSEQRYSCQSSTHCDLGGDRERALAREVLERGRTASERARCHLCERRSRSGHLTHATARSSWGPAGAFTNSAKNMHHNNKRCQQQQQQRRRMTRRTCWSARRLPAAIAALSKPARPFDSSKALASSGVNCTQIGPPRSRGRAREANGSQRAVEPVSELSRGAPSLLTEALRVMNELRAPRTDALALHVVTLCMRAIVARLYGY